LGITRKISKPNDKLSRLSAGLPLLYDFLKEIEMAIKEDKFIVFPKKDLVGISVLQLSVLNEIDQLVQLNRAKRGANPFPKFITCNQDEPYAEKVWQIILDGETEKEHHG
jgi:hypothetical protein